MADDLHFVPGDFYRICDRTGFKVRAGKSKMEWTGHIVRNQSWESRQPQDFVRGVVDNQSVTNPRPRQTDVLIGPLQATIAQAANAGSTTLALSSTVRMQANDKLSIILDSKDTFFCTLAALNSQTSISVSPALPYSVSVGNLVTDTTAVSLPFIG